MASTPVTSERHVLNVGFGLGIIDTALQARGPGKHTIIEAHPEVYARMQREGWTQKPGRLGWSGSVE